MNVELCPCHSGKTHLKCCHPFLSGQAKARTVTQLMRSRYSAYALGGYGEYLFRTWHPANRGSLQPKDVDLITTNWTNLEVLKAQQSGDRGIVEFIAHFAAEDGSQGTHHELSTFVREMGHWLYLDGHEIEDQ